MLTARLRALTPGMLRGIRRGIEKESLRVRADGRLADTPHPPGLGSPLTHPHITTDFSEAQLELITGVHQSVDACLDELAEIHQAVHRHLDGELLWCASMPCKLPRDEDIPIARYGTSNVGRVKTVYRLGLSHRYGRRMQAISGIHYNFSLPDEAWAALQLADARGGPARAYRDDAYFALIRNFRRHAWLLLYLIGASPAVCASFVAGRAHGLQPLAPDTLHLPHATSLRMGRLGYQSDAQASLAVSYNALDSYARSLREALTVPYPPYAALGVRDGDDYRQLGTTLLQIENEFYGTIRPKRRVNRGERPLRALRTRGVEYVEARCVDLDPESFIGITAGTVRLLDVFLLHCALADSPPDTPPEIAEIARNQQLVSGRGRDPALRLARHGAEIGPREWGAELLRACDPIAAALDEACGGAAHRDALDVAARALRDPESTPSARSLREMSSRHGGSFGQYALARSRAHHQHLEERPLPPAAAAAYDRMAAESLAAQRDTEAGDTLAFEEFRQQYLALPD